MSVVDEIKRAAEIVFGGETPENQARNLQLAVATAQLESGLDPRAVGDHGSSFGLFQLHRGGELGNMSPDQAFDPFTNATRALAEFKVIEANNPGILQRDPGQVAALAQRPADPAGYAAKIDALLKVAPAPNIDGLSPGQLGQKGVDAVVGAVVGAIAAGLGAAGHGIANFTTAGLHNLGGVLAKQAIALSVAAVVLIVLFSK